MFLRCPPMSSLGKSGPSVTSQALPTGAGAHPELVHGHPVCLRPDRGVDGVGDHGADFGFAQFLDLRTLDLTGRRAARPLPGAETVGAGRVRDTAAQ